MTATIASAVETTRRLSCVSLNGGSVCAGASAFSAGIFSNACTRDEEIEMNWVTSRGRVAQIGSFEKKIVQKVAMVC